MNIQLSDHFTYSRLIRFVIPSIVMMIFTSIYGVVDGIFISNYAGSTAFASVNLIMPYAMIFSALGFMFGSGGTALVSMTMGEGKDEKANQIFTLLVYTLITCGIFFTVIGELMLPTMAKVMGADDEMFSYCVAYGRIILISLTGFMLQGMMQSFMVTAERPQLGLFITVAAGVGNIVGDFVLVGMLKLGVQGAALATVTSEFIGGLVPLFYFLGPNTSRLRLTKPYHDLRILVRVCTNGASELMTNVSLSLVNAVYNLQLMRMIGQNGVAVYGIIMYVNFIFISMFIGYSVGSAPLIGFNYGAQRHDELQNLLRKSLIIICSAAVILKLLSQLMAQPLSFIFVGYDSGLRELTEHAFTLYSFSYLLAGFNIFASAFFTALSNGPVSALISFSRVLLFQLASVLLLPLIFGIDGIWTAIVAAEFCTLLLSAVCVLKLNGRYRYIR